MLYSKNFFRFCNAGYKAAKPIWALPLESVDSVNTTENQEQAAATPRRKRLIFVPFRPAALPTMAAQTP